MPKRRYPLLFLSAILVLVIAGLFAGTFARSVRVFFNDRRADRLAYAALIGASNPALKLQMRDLLEGGELSRQKGELLLRTLVSPRVLARPSYGFWYPPVAKLALDAPDFKTLDLRISARARAGTKILGEAGEFTAAQASVPEFEFAEAVAPDGKIIRITTSGAFTAALEVDLKLYPPGAASAPVYESVLSLPFHFIVTNQLALTPLASAELEGRVRECISVIPTGRTNPLPPVAGPPENLVFKRKAADADSATAPPLTVQIKSDLLFRISNAPANLSLGIKYRDDSAVEHLSTNFHLLVRTGGSAEFSLQQVPDVFGLTTSKHYLGDVFLFTDARQAYADPLINDVWRGVVGFQVEFDVVPKTDK